MSVTKIEEYQIKVLAREMTLDEVNQKITRIEAAIGVAPKEQYPSDYYYELAINRNNNHIERLAIFEKVRCRLYKIEEVKRKYPKRANDPDFIDFVLDFF